MCIKRAVSSEPGIGSRLPGGKSLRRVTSKGIAPAFSVSAVVSTAFIVYIYAKTVMFKSIRAIVTKGVLFE